jgi:nucleoside-diphosphate-sugar epimerase
MARVFITGSADGLGRAAAQTLLNDGHQVVVHARNRDRLTAVRDLLDRGAAAVVGDLSDLEETRGLARDVNRLGRLDAVIHNAGVYTGPHVLPVNVVAPYLLTALIDRPQRLIYLSSSEHRSGRPSLTGIDWSGRRTNRVLSGQQALCHHAHRCRRPEMGGGVQQRGGPRLGAHQDGRTRCARRSAARAPHAGVACH